jgi:hypothetical protein
MIHSRSRSRRLCRGRGRRRVVLYWWNCWGYRQKARAGDQYNGGREPKFVVEGLTSDTSGSDKCNRRPRA